MRKRFDEVGKLKCHSILLHTRKSRISVKVIFSPKQNADKDSCMEKCKLILAPYLFLRR